MKLAWLCYPYSYDDDDEVRPEFKTVEPQKHQYARVIAIVYSELKKRND